MKKLLRFATKWNLANKLESIHLLAVKTAVEKIDSNSRPESVRPALIDNQV